MRRPLLVLPLLLAVGLTLGACGIIGKGVEQYACPKVLILGDAGTLVRFKPGPGRDITDILLEARIANFIGGCEYTKEGVEVRLRVLIAVERGAASRDSAISFEYFAAIPEFLPRPEGKRILPVRGEFPENLPRLVYQDEIDMFIPLADNATGPEKEIVLGFQLSPAELEYNRSTRRR